MIIHTLGHKAGNVKPAVVHVEGDPAVPEVDDLLSMSLDLWAGSEGFTRLEPGLAGV